MNQCIHDHFCFECGKPFRCDFPECLSLSGQTQRLCQRCSYLYGWKQNRERKTQDDFNALDC